MTNLYDVARLNALEEGYGLITATSRLASAIEVQWLKTQSSENKGFVKEAKPILALTHFIDLFFNQSPLYFKKHAKKLSSLQSVHVLEHIIRNSKAGESLLNVSNTAKSVFSAYQICKNWQVDYKSFDGFESENVKSYIQWIGAFEQWCADNNALSEVGLFASLVADLQSAQGNDRWIYPFDWPKKLVFVGFDDYPPILEAFIAALQKMGGEHYPEIEIIKESLADPCAKVCVQSFDNQMDEWSTIAKKAKILSEENQSVAVVIPELTANLSKIESIFMQVFHPESIFKPVEFDSRVKDFNISRGRSLLQYPLVQSAFNIFKLCMSIQSKTIELSLLKEILQCPHSFTTVNLGHQEEKVNSTVKEDKGFNHDTNIDDEDASSQYFRKIKLLSKLEDEGFETISLESLLAKSKDMPKFHQSLLNLCQNLKVESNQELSVWRWFFWDWLDLAHWAKARELSSIEYQVLKRFSDLSEELASLELCYEKVGMAKAISLLRDLAAECVFQAQSNFVNVHVLGVLEASGLSFDHIFFCNLNAECWPSPAIPNPFIPTHLQKELNMPHASADRELKFSSAIMARVSSSTQSLVLSYSKNHEGRALMPSPLIPHQLGNANFAGDSELVSSDDTVEKILSYESSHVTSYLITKDEGLRANIKQLSASLLNTQAVCPFKAYVSSRLYVKPKPKINLGLSAIERGELVHAVFEAFWNRVGNQEALFNFQKNVQYDSAVMEIVRSVIKRSKSYALKKNMHGLWTLEEKRLALVLERLLLLEKDRPKFTVKGHELKFVLKLLDTDITCRVDRIDINESNNSHMIIDYKTGIVSTYEWFNEHLSQLQLPLYSLLHENVSLVCFAQINASGDKWLGAGDENYFKGIIPLGEGWGAQIDEWKSKIKQVLQSYLDGDASIQPAMDKYCLNCDIKPICRHHHEDTI